MEARQRILYFCAAQPLEPFGEACLSLTPKISTYNSQEIFLDIAPTERLFGGEAHVLFKAHNLASQFGVKGSLVLTDRPEWARALALEPEVILAPGKSQEMLLKLPIERMEHCGDPFTIDSERKERRDLIAFMKRVGLKLISDFLRLSTTAIGRRFGKMGILLQEWVEGKREVLLPPFVPEEKILESIDAEEVGSLETLFLFLEPALQRMEERLRGRALTAKEIELRFFLESHPMLSKKLAFSESLQEASRMLRLLKEFLRELSWESPLTRLEIEVSDTERYQPGQLSLLDDCENHFSDLAQYVSRLRARLGAEAVGFPALKESYLPERSWTQVWPPVSEKTEPYPVPNRPLFLFTPPTPCHPPTRAWRLTPTENLMAEWWEEGGFRRYFIAENPRGERLWIFWDIQRKGWFLHGTFD